MSNAPIPEDLKRRTSGHGYHYGCECDMEGGDASCAIQPPYETMDDYISRLIERIAAVEAERRDANLRAERTAEKSMELSNEVDLLRAERDALKQRHLEQARETIKQLSAPVSDAELGTFAIHAVDLVEPVRRVPALIPMQANALIAARARERQ